MKVLIFLVAALQIASIYSACVPAAPPCKRAGGAGKGGAAGGAAKKTAPAVQTIVIKVPAKTAPAKTAPAKPAAPTISLATPMKEVNALKLLVLAAAKPAAGGAGPGG